MLKAKNETVAPFLIPILLIIKRTKIENVKTKIEVKYKWDYSRKEFLETNPSEEEIKLYDETTPLWIHPKTKAIQKEVNDEQLDKSKQP